MKDFKMRKTLVILLLSVSFTIQSYSQKLPEQENQNESLQNLDIDQAVILAADNNVSLKRQRLSLELLEKKNKSSWNSLSPSLSLSGSGEFDLNNDAAFAWAVNGGIRISFTPALFSSIKTAKLNYENGIFNYEQAIRAIELNVRKLFYSLILTEESLVQQKRNIESAHQRYKSNLEKYNKGQLSQVNLLTSQYNYESLLPAYESAVIAYENNLANFKQILGIEQNQEIKLIGNLEDFLTDGQINADYDINQLPVIKSLNAQKSLTETALLATQFSAYSPVISANYSYGYMGTKNHSSETGNKISISASLPLDGFLPWTNGALSIESQKIALEDLELQIENEKINTQIEIDNSIKKIKQAKSQLSSLQKNIDLAQKTYDLTQEAYNYGSTDLLTLQTTSDAVMNAKNTQRSQVYTLICAILDLENTLGIPFGTLIDNSNQ